MEKQKILFMFNYGWVKRTIFKTRVQDKFVIATQLFVNTVVREAVAS